ncbi:hypothetical protein AMECASPLE_005745 [Ameca splendens]|uniref:Uncharacterized protein n=1 Tax=Ameca splendens TaxID=208324 RepID=A0ABV0XZE5_9TELE
MGWKSLEHYGLHRKGSENIWRNIIISNQTGTLICKPTKMGPEKVSTNQKMCGNSGGARDIHTSDEGNKLSRALKQFSLKMATSV